MFTVPLEPHAQGLYWAVSESKDPRVQEFFRQRGGKFMVSYEGQTHSVEIVAAMGESSEIWIDGKAPW